MNWALKLTLDYKKEGLLEESPFAIDRVELGHGLGLSELQANNAG